MNANSIDPRSHAKLSLITPDWPAPGVIKAFSTTRLGGVSGAPFDSLNLGYHPRDNPQSVHANRCRLAQAIDLPAEPVWLKQVHGNTVVDAGHVEQMIEADAAYARQRATVCAVMTADCLPILFCDRAASQVAAAHAGWRGLAQSVIAETIASFACDPAQLMAWLGPAIGSEVYEVGAEVRAAFLALDEANRDCFKASPTGRWLADLYALARRQLERAGVAAIYGSGWCTYSDSARFFSYRRDGSSGRMASLVWIAD